MKKRFVAFAIATVLATNTVQAETGAHPEPLSDAHQQQALGVGIGSVAGALIAGPPGLVAGGILGAFIGWNEGLRSDLDASHEVLEKRQAELATLETHNRLLVAQASESLSLDAGFDGQPMADLSKALTADLSLDVYFRSGSAQLETYYEKRLDAIASLLNAFPSLQIELAGFADRRGSEPDNERLSTERVHAVKTALMAGGIDPQRIRSQPHGESRPVSKAGDAQAYAFDRRVQLYLSLEQPAPKAPVALLKTRSTESQ